MGRVCISFVWKPKGKKTSFASGLGGFSDASGGGLKGHLLRKLSDQSPVLRVIGKAKYDFLCPNKSRNYIPSFLQHCTKKSFSKPSPILSNNVINISMMDMAACMYCCT